MRVKIKPEFCDEPEESEIIFEVIEDNGDRCLIEPVEYDMPIKPTEMIEKYMLEIVE